jgi:hypothetical protein
MKVRKVGLFVLVGSLVVPLAQAEVQHIEMRVEGMTWNFWAYGVKKHLERQVGVQKVEVSLLDGRVDITPNGDGRIDPGQLLKATFDSGVTVVEMDLTARGPLVQESSGGLALQVEANRFFGITPNELSKGLEPLMNKQTVLTVRGRVYQKPVTKGKANVLPPLRLLILEVKTGE